VALTKNNELYKQTYNSGPVHLDKILRWSKFADWLNGTNLPPPKVCLPEGHITAAQEYLRPTVVLVPFSAIKEKQISPDVFLKIMDHLKNNYDFIVAGAPGDFDINPEYLILLETRNTTFDTSTFEDLAAKLMRVDLVVSVDTAAMHLSASLGTPTVCLASAAYVNEIVPYSSEVIPDNVRFVFLAMKCQGCLGRCSLPLEDNRFPCVARLKPNHILNAIDEFLIK
jgi:ADP-heptose:LPS heptosyltransferase